MNEKYLTPEDFAIAESNGIPKVNVTARIRGGWSKKRAITVPYKPRPKTHLKYTEQLKENGIGSNLFYARLGQGWSEEEAASTPKLTQQERLLRANKGRVIPKEIKELAEKNGIGIYTLRQRIGQYGWDPKKAATEPIRRKDL